MWKQCTPARPPPRPLTGRAGQRGGDNRGTVGSAPLGDGTTHPHWVSRAGKTEAKERRSGSVVHGRTGAGVDGKGWRTTFGDILQHSSRRRNADGEGLISGPRGWRQSAQKFDQPGRLSLSGTRGVGRGDAGKDGGRYIEPLRRHGRPGPNSVRRPRTLRPPTAPGRPTSFRTFSSSPRRCSATTCWSWCCWPSDATCRRPSGTVEAAGGAARAGDGLSEAPPSTTATGARGTCPFRGSSPRATPASVAASDYPTSTTTSRRCAGGGTGSAGGGGGGRGGSCSCGGGGSRHSGRKGTSEPKRGGVSLRLRWGRTSFEAKETKSGARKEKRGRRKRRDGGRGSGRGGGVNHRRRSRTRRDRRT